MSNEFTKLYVTGFYYDEPTEKWSCSASTYRPTGKIEFYEVEIRVPSIEQDKYGKNKGTLEKKEKY